MWESNILSLLEMIVSAKSMQFIDYFMHREAEDVLLSFMHLCYHSLYITINITPDIFYSTEFYFESLYT